MSGHGHVIPNADGSKARCGGPGLCVQCSLERSRLYVEQKAKAKGIPWKVELVDVYDVPFEDAARSLYLLLSERRPYQSISHKAMPSYFDHCAFVQSRPYWVWYLIHAIDTPQHVPDIAGSIYLTTELEVGLFVFERHQGRGIGRRAFQQLRVQFPNERLIANIAPANELSQQFFERLGFKLIQKTYELPA